MNFIIITINLSAQLRKAWKLIEFIIIFYVFLLFSSTLVSKQVKRKQSFENMKRKNLKSVTHNLFVVAWRKKGIELEGKPLKSS